MAAQEQHKVMLPKYLGDNQPHIRASVGKTELHGNDKGFFIA